MRKLIYLIWFLPCICLAQTKDDLFYLIDKFPLDKAGNVHWCITDSITNTNRESLHSRAIQAIDYFFKDSPAPYSGANDMITYRGRFGRYERAKKTFSTVFNEYIYRFTLNIEYKDNWYKIDIYDISESTGNITTDLSTMINKEYYNKTRLTAGALKSKYYSIYFVYNYLTSKIRSIDLFMKQTGQRIGK